MWAQFWLHKNNLKQSEGVCLQVHGRQCARDTYSGSEGVHSGQYKKVRVVSAYYRNKNGESYKAVCSHRCPHVKEGTAKSRHIVQGAQSTFKMVEFTIHQPA